MVGKGPYGVYVTKFHWLLDTLCLRVEQGPYGVYVTRPLWSVRYEVSLVVGHPVFDENSACWIPMRHETLSGGDVKLYLLPRQLILSDTVFTTRPKTVSWVAFCRYAWDVKRC